MNTTCLFVCSRWLLGGIAQVCGQGCCRCFRPCPATVCTVTQAHPKEIFPAVLCNKPWSWLSPSALHSQRCTSCICNMLWCPSGTAWPEALCTAGWLSLSSARQLMLKPQVRDQGRGHRLVTQLGWGDWEQSCVWKRSSWQTPQLLGMSACFSFIRGTEEEAWIADEQS